MTQVMSIDGELIESPERIHVSEKPTNGTLGDVLSMAPPLQVVLYLMENNNDLFRSFGEKDEVIGSLLVKSRDKTEPKKSVYEVVGLSEPTFEMSSSGLYVPKNDCIETRYAVDHRTGFVTGFNDDYKWALTKDMSYIDGLNFHFFASPGRIESTGTYLFFVTRRSASSSKNPSIKCIGLDEKTSKSDFLFREFGINAKA
ncbi:MAG: hypothetical protein HY513_03140 [Candidatus Aenigmarchaeota archaeon]|nr:hypothetical protein [Candidatus Aenigmarchaeota archaeon]